MAPRKAIYVVLLVILNYWYDIRKWYLEALGCPGISCTACPWTCDLRTQKCLLSTGLKMSIRQNIYINQCFILHNHIQICAKVNKFPLTCKWIKLDGMALKIQSLLKVLPNKGIFHRTWNSFSNEIHNTQCNKCQRYNFATIWKHLKHIHIVGKPFMVRHLDNCFNMPMHFLSVCIGTEAFNQWKFTQVSWWQNQFLYERLKKLWVKLCVIVLLCYWQWKFLLLLQFWGFEQNPKHFEIVEFRF